MCRTNGSISLIGKTAVIKRPLGTSSLICFIPFEIPFRRLSAAIRLVPFCLQQANSVETTSNGRPRHRPVSTTLACR